MGEDVTPEDLLELSDITPEDLLEAAEALAFEPEPDPVIEAVVKESVAEFNGRYPWATFLAGRWVRNAPPKRAGIYPCRPLDGGRWSLRTWTRLTGGILREADVPPGEPGWQGWRWSVPLPDPPPSPEI